MSGISFDDIAKNVRGRHESADDTSGVHDTSQIKITKSHLLSTIEITKPQHSRAMREMTE